MSFLAMKRRFTGVPLFTLLLLLALFSPTSQARALPATGSQLEQRAPLGQSPISAAYPRSTDLGSDQSEPRDPLCEVKELHSGHTSPLAHAMADTTTDAEKQKDGVASATSGKPLINFEVNVPPRWLPKDDQESSTTVLIQRSFANSYYKPSLLSYSPSLLPEKFRDPTKWTSIVLEQRGVAVGRQFDRLGSIYLGNKKNGYSAEIWRTDNAQPVQEPPGVLWETHKDVSQYYDLFRQDGELIFDYPNIVDKTYTAPLNITLSITIHQLKSAPVHSNDALSANATTGPASISESKAGVTPLAPRTPLIFPISKRNQKAASHWAVPGEKALDSFAIPTNAVQALVEIYASGTADDEFWYGSFNTDIYDKLPNKTSLGFPHGAYREIRLYIDGILAGAVAPYPILFTGGINPLMWRPQAGFGSYDQPTYLLDITAFLGILCDGRKHDFEIRVTSAEADETINNSWFVSGNLQVLLGDGLITSGSTPMVEETSIGESFVQSGSIDGVITSPNGSLTSAVTTTPSGRKVKISSKLSPAGTTDLIDVVTEYVIHYSSKQTLTESATENNVIQTSSGSQKSTHGNTSFLATSYSYPLKFHILSDQHYLNTTLDHQYNLEQQFYPSPSSPSSTAADADAGNADAVAAASAPSSTKEESDDDDDDDNNKKPSSSPSPSPRSDPSNNTHQPYRPLQFAQPKRMSIKTHQEASGSAAKINASLTGVLGETQQTYSYVDSDGYTFSRTVDVANRVVGEDRVDGSLKSQALPVQ